MNNESKKLPKKIFRSEFVNTFWNQNAALIKQTLPFPKIGVGSASIFQKDQSRCENLERLGDETVTGIRWYVPAEFRWFPQKKSMHRAGEWKQTSLDRNEFCTLKIRWSWASNKETDLIWDSVLPVTSTFSSDSDQKIFNATNHVRTQHWNNWGRHWFVLNRHGYAYPFVHILGGAPKTGQTVKGHYTGETERERSNECIYDHFISSRNLDGREEIRFISWSKYSIRI